MAESSNTPNQPSNNIRNQNQPDIEIDRAATDNDSTYGAELSTYTASLTSSVLNYRNENGRTYHG